MLGYGRLKFSKMAAGRHLEFDPTGNGAVRSAVPENPTLERNTKSIGRRVAEIWPFEVVQEQNDIKKKTLQTVLARTIIVTL